MCHGFCEPKCVALRAWKSHFYVKCCYSNVAIASQCLEVKPTYHQGQDSAKIQLSAAPYLHSQQLVPLLSAVLSLPLDILRLVMLSPHSSLVLTTWEACFSPLELWPADNLYLFFCLHLPLVTPRSHSPTAVWRLSVALSWDLSDHLRNVEVTDIRKKWSHCPTSL